MNYPLIALSNNARRALFINEGRRWKGVQEIGGNNKGQLVELFLKSCKIPAGNPWCMGFVQFCLADVASTEMALTGKSTPLPFPVSAHCLTVWNKTPETHRGQEPKAGAIVIWRQGKTDSGHTGIVVSVEGKKVTTIEGNTGSKVATREGDGVFEKTHSTNMNGTLTLVGYIYPWGKE